jgi:polysaccharide pyruvyl transferase WcaK-like protein
MRTASPRVGLFGLLGSGNIGNDASVDVIVRYLRAEHSDAVVDAMCMGWQRMRDRYGIETVPIQWQSARRLPSGPLGAGLKALGKVLDVFRTASWVRGHDIVIVPGMGIMDATLPINPWGVPWSLFVLTATGRLLGAKVALVSVGATPARNPITGWLYKSSARLARYRSFRDVASSDVLRRQGLDTSRDPIYPDLVFLDPIESDAQVDPLAVGVGVIAYHGASEDRDRADEIYATYVSRMKSFVRALIDGGRSVRLFVGDECDQPVVDEILADIRQYRPSLDQTRITGAAVTTFAEVTELIAPVATVVASRFHNILLARKLGKPTISIAYSPKIDSLMEDLGLAEFNQQAKSLDHDELMAQFIEAEDRAPQIREQLRKLVPERGRLVRAQLDELNSVLFGRQLVLAARSASPVLNTRCAPAGGAPKTDRTRSSSKALSSLTLTKSRIAVPAQSASATGAPRPSCRSRVSTVRKSTLYLARPDVFGMDLWSCAPENSSSSPGAGSGITSRLGVWPIAAGLAWLSLPTDFAVLSRRELFS